MFQRLVEFVEGKVSPLSFCFGSVGAGEVYYIGPGKPPRKHLKSQKAARRRGTGANIKQNMGRSGKHEKTVGQSSR